jgi:hypothetical protein
MSEVLINDAKWTKDPGEMVSREKATGRAK